MADQYIMGVKVPTVTQVSVPGGGVGYVPTWENPAAPAPAAPPPNQPPPVNQPPPGPSAEELAQRQRDAIIAEMARQEADRLNRQRTSAWETMTSTFKSFGIDVDGTGLSQQVRDWVFSDKSEAFVMVELRKTAAYNNRFTGMADLIKRGQFMNEAQYIEMERAYRNTMTQWGIPTEFYDEYKDFGRFIANGVSVAEVDDRIRSAKEFLDTETPSDYRNALSAMGISSGTLIAHLLNGDRAQSAIQREVKQAATMGAANQFGFDLNVNEGLKYSTVLGDQFNTFGDDQRTALEKQYGELGIQASNDSRLAFIDRQDDFSKTDILDAELLNDNDKKLASQRRGEREKNRFAGKSGFTPGITFDTSGF